MITKQPVVFCRDCKHSKPEPHSAFNLRCHNPEVNRNDSWALASTINGHGSDCSSERSKSSWFSRCGIKGKLYELKEVPL